MKTQKKYCLFDKYELQPEPLKKIVDKYNMILENNQTYQNCEKFLKAVEKIGFTFDYYLDAIPYGLRPINTPLNELQGFNEL